MGGGSEGCTIRVSRGAVSEKAGGTVSYLTCCAQPGRREGHEDCANSGDADEDEGVEALAGFFRLVVDMVLGSTLWTYIAGGFGPRISREGFGSAAKARS